MPFWALTLIAGVFAGGTVGLFIGAVVVSARGTRGGLLELDTPVARGVLADRDDWFRP